MFRKNIVVSAIAAIAFALLPAISTHAATPNTTVTYNGVTFTSSDAGGTGNPDGTGKSASGCNGTIIGVYGSSALKSYIQQAAKDFCNSPANINHYDVEYAGGGDSCPGDTFAAGDSTDPVVGVSDVFAPSCANDGVAGADATQINDQPLSTNIVEAIATCPGATEPNGGAVHPAGTTPCGSFSTDPASMSAASCSPAALSLAQAQLLYSQAVGNEQSVGGCNHTNAVQNRVNGSGTRITFCFNVYGPGIDNCKNEGAAQPLAGTTGTMVKDVCGGPVPSGQTGTAGNYAQGYASRGAVVVDPRNAAGSITALQGCGVVTLGGFSGYNGTCDTTNPTGTGGQPSSVDGVINCPGDNDVAAGRYQVWGYEHLVTNVANNAAATSFVNFLLNTPSEDNTLTRQQGFMQLCQMGVKRTADAGPYSLTSATC